MKIRLRNRRQLLISIVIQIILLSSYYARPLFAQDYAFDVPRLEMDVRIQKDASAILQYNMDFNNYPGAHVLDIVDIGLPYENHNFGNMSASLNGTSARTIRTSQYVKPGVEVHLPNGGIPGGESGNFKFEATIPDLVFQDTTRKDYASFQITPTWFDSKFVRGSTKQIIRVHLPEGLNPDEALYQDIGFSGKEEVDGHVVLSWEANRSLVGPYRVGVSFPKRVMNRIVEMTISEMIVNWYLNSVSEGTRIILLLGSALLFAIVFFRFTGGTGGCLFVILLIAAAIWIGNWPPAQLAIWPVLLVLAVVVETTRRRKKSKYLPAIASVEGGGIKRGLTAPEAAVLLELPSEKVATLILFGMLKKSLIQQNKASEFSVEKAPPPDVITHDYEKSVLDTLSKKKDSLNRLDFTSPMKALIASVVAKMAGFNLDETREYYQHIISRAWKEAQETGDLNLWQKKMDEKVDWMLLDPNFNDRFRPYQDRYIPRSYRTGGWGGSSAGGTSGSGSSSPSPSSGGPRFTDIAASMTGWMQNTSGQVITQLEGQKGGILNLGGFDKAVGKALKSGGSGGSGRSGGGGGCACACAGCACACACAGGGR